MADSNRCSPLTLKIDFSGGLFSGGFDGVARGAQIGGKPNTVAIIQHWLGDTYIMGAGNTLN